MRKLSAGAPGFRDGWQGELGIILKPGYPTPCSEPLVSRFHTLAVLVAISTNVEAQPDAKAEPKFARTEDVIYGRRDGHALTMDVFTPTAKPNGAGVIVCVSAEYSSGRELLDGLFHPLTTVPFLDRGYVVFAVLHSSQPRYTIPDAVEVPSVSESQPPWEAIPNGARLSYESLILARNQIWQWVRGFVDPQVTGPVGIAQSTGEVVHQAGWLSLINFAGLLSMNLAVLNVLPIPMFDGGRLVFILIEFLRRGRRVAPQKEALVHLTGLALILTLSVVITYFDILRVFHGDSLLK